MDDIRQKGKRDGTKNLRPKPWKPGQSGNPAGSSKKQRERSAIKSYFEEMGLERDFVEVAVNAAMKGQHEFWRMVSERLWGKVPDRLESVNTVVWKRDADE